MVIRTLLPLLLTFVAFTGSASAAKLDAPWTGSGPGTTKVVSNGVAADPQFDYLLNDFSGAWSYSTVAATTRSVGVAYDSSGFYSWYQVTTKLVAFVSRGGVDVTAKTLAQEGPTDCCSAPSGGFAYKGTTTFDVKAGDVYGFRVSGSNFTGGPVMSGSLKLQELDSTAPVVTPVVTGKQIAGDFYAGAVDVRWTVADDDSRILTKTDCGDVSVADGSGDKTVTCTATSRGGKTVKSVTVKRDREAPSLTVPSAVVKQAAGGAGNAVVTYDAVATDTVDPAPVVACTPASGAQFALGTTTVTCTATDAAGNVATKSFDAIVFPGAAAQPWVNPSPGGPVVPAGPTVAPKPINAVLAFRFTIARKTTRLIQLRVKNLPKGATVSVTCKGPSCPKRLKGSGSTMKSKGSTLSLSTLVKANLKGGTTINIAISASGAVTTIKSLAVRKGKAPVVNTCTASGTRPVAC
jgi:hypothetical protein